MISKNPESQEKIILSGMRPTGKLHLGHLVGALENWFVLQKEYRTYYLIADYHALTTNPDSSRVYEHTIDMVIDWLSTGINPSVSPIFRQSQVKQHAELHLIFSMLVTASRLERNPTLKEQIRDLNLNTITYGHLGYPVLQAADILLYKGEVIPVGEDQAPHIEITREIARKFNSLYGKVFPEPEAKLTKFARLPGLDGNRMSKSAGNAILIADSTADIKKKMMQAVTDPQKIRKNDPGRPDICLVFTFHNKFNPDEVEEVRKGCESGSLGCVECKTRCAERVIQYTEPIREKRRHYEKNLKEIENILHEGEEKAGEVAHVTMQEVRKAMKVGVVK